MADETTGGDALTAEEQSYISSRGEAPLLEASETAAPEAQAEAEAPGEEDETDAPAEPGKRRDFVAEIRKEREKRKALEERSRAAELELANYRGKMEILAQAGRQPEPEPDEPPSWDEDVFAAGAHLQTEVQTLKQQIDEQRRQQAAADHEAKLMNWTAQSEAQFKAQTPDFEDAANHLFTARLGVMTDLGMPEAQAKAALKREFLGVIDLCARNNENPAAKVYAMAKRFGYRPSAKAGDTMERLEQAERSQSAHKSLSAGTPAATGDMTPDKLLAMSDEDFLAYTKKNSKTARRLMGGG